MNNQRSINQNTSDLTDKHVQVMEDFEQLLESGIADQTMSDIASRLKVSLRTLYEIAPSKEDLIVSTMDRILTNIAIQALSSICLLYTSPSPRDATLSRMPSSA